ncbi:ORF6N domain-containing protein [Viscerimonas tarda]
MQKKFSVKRLEQVRDILSLTTEEWNNLRSKISTSSWGGKHKLPNVFSERGLYMIATILKGKKATETTLEIIETFAKVKELKRTIAEIGQQPDIQIQKSYDGIGRNQLKNYRLNCCK